MANCKRNKRVRKVKQIDYKKKGLDAQGFFEHMLLNEKTSKLFHEALLKDKRFLKEEKGDLIELHDGLTTCDKCFKKKRIGIQCINTTSIRCQYAID